MDSSILVPARKFARLLDYMDQIGLDPEPVAAAGGMSYRQVMDRSPDERLPGADYSRMYCCAVEQWQTLNTPIPWGAGIGTEAFQLMCHALISSKTLGAALEIASRFDQLMYPMLNYRVSLERGATESALNYHVRIPEEGSVFAPDGWDRAEHTATVAQASGLLVWHSLCGWLTGQVPILREVHIEGAYVSDEYQRGLATVFDCAVRFDAGRTCFISDNTLLERRLVQTIESLEEFLRNSVYQLISFNKAPASTSSAIRSLMKRDFSQGIPTFEAMATDLHMSESSLRRRLIRENTSYQAIKDSVRCEVAIEHLRHRATKISELAELLGFSETSSFVRSFRNWMGVTPKAYQDRVAVSL